MKVAARILSLRWTLIAIAAIWVAAAVHLHQQRVPALRATVEGMADGASEALGREMRNIDQTLLYVRALYARDCQAFDLEPWVHSAEVADRRVWPIVVASADGLETYSDLRHVTARVDVSNLQAFRHFADPTSAHLDDHLFIGDPVRGRDTEASAIPFARPLMTPLGRFDGIAMVTLDASALVPASPYSDATVTGLDGIVRATLPDHVRPGKASTTRVARAGGGRRSGHAAARGAGPGKQRRRDRARSSGRRGERAGAGHA
jgi:hypothetical protein